MRLARGFTLIELLIAMAVVALLTAVALPSYTAYVKRSKVPVALDGLSSLATRMEQCFQDTGTYTSCSPCGSGIPTPANFTLSCSIANDGKTYSASATGSGQLSGYTYTINPAGARATTAHPKGANATCWTAKGTQCDS